MLSVALANSGELLVFSGSCCGGQQRDFLAAYSNTMPILFYARGKISQNCNDIFQACQSKCEQKNNSNSCCYNFNRSYSRKCTFKQCSNIKFYDCTLKIVIECRNNMYVPISSLLYEGGLQLKLFLKKEVPK